MVVQLLSGEIFGIDGRVVEIEVDLQPGVSNFVISGLPGKGIRESRERIRTAILNSGFRFPQRRVVVNLAPAVWEKDGSGFDLAIALGIAIASGQIQCRAASELGVVGELSLDGAIRPVAGTLSLVAALRDRGVRALLVPVANLEEALAIPGSTPEGVENLRHAAELIEGKAIGTVHPPRAAAATRETWLDFSQVVGHPRAKRALSVAAAGRHNVLLIGSPGAGKSLLARCLPHLIPSYGDRPAPSY